MMGYYSNMMGYYSNMMGNVGIFGFLTWILFMTFLVLGIAYFWREIQQPKRK